MNSPYSFDPEGHIHRLNGHIVPGATTLLHDENFVDDRWFTTWGRDKGTAFHRAKQLYNMNDLDWDSVDLQIEGYLRAYIKWLEESRFKVVHCEEPVWSLIWGFAAIPDDVGYFPNDSVISIVEDKTWSVQPWVRLQTALCQIGLQEVHPEYTRVKRYGLELRENGTYSMPEEYRDRSDIGVAQALVTVHKWKANNLKNGGRHE